MRSCNRSYTTKEFAFANKLAYVDNGTTVIMKGDDSTTLDPGVYRNRCVPLCMTGLMAPDAEDAPVL